MTTVLSLKLVSFSFLLPGLVEVSTFDGRLCTPQVSIDFLNNDLFEAFYTHLNIQQLNKERIYRLEFGSIVRRKTLVVPSAVQ